MRRKRHAEASTLEKEPLCRELFPDREILNYLRKNKYFSAKDYRGRPYFHFRCHEKSQSTDNLYPTRKGIALLTPQMKNILDIAETLLEKAEQWKENEYVWHLGYGVYITVAPYNGLMYVDIRRFWKPDTFKEPVPTKSGLKIIRAEWSNFPDILSVIGVKYPELFDVQPCEYLFEGNQFDS